MKFNYFNLIFVVKMKYMKRFQFFLFIDLQYEIQVFPFNLW